MENNKRRVAITGFGIISSLGNTTMEVLNALQQNRSGVEVVPEWKEMGLKSFIAGTIKNFDQKAVLREIGAKSRYMDENSLYCTVASREAIKMSELSEEILVSENTSCIAGNGLSSSDPIVRAGLAVNGHKSNVMPYDINRSMSSSCSANLAYYLGVKGRSYSISSACTVLMARIFVIKKPRSGVVLNLI